MRRHPLHATAAAVVAALAVVTAACGDDGAADAGGDGRPRSS